MAREKIDEPDALDMRRALTAWVLEHISGIRIGVVQSYDQAQRVAVVQPVRRRQIFRTPQPLPVVRAPVGWWRFGTMVLAGEVQQGDEVLLVTCEREIWPWYAGGQPLHDPTSERMHDPSDSIALPWISNVKRAITARAPLTFYMGREDGTASVTITQGPAPGSVTVEGTGPGSIVLGSAAVQPALLGTSANSAINTYAAAATAAAAALSGSAVTWGGGGLTDAQFASTFTTWSGALLTAQTALATALTAAIAVKVRVE